MASITRVAPVPTSFVHVREAASTEACTTPSTLIVTTWLATARPAGSGQVQVTVTVVTGVPAVTSPMVGLASGPTGVVEAGGDAGEQVRATGPDSVLQTRIVTE